MVSQNALHPTALKLDQNVRRLTGFWFHQSPDEDGGAKGLTALREVDAYSHEVGDMFYRLMITSWSPQGAHWSSWC